MYLDTYPISSNSLEKFYHIDGDQLGRQYKDHLSDYTSWAQRSHADDWMTFPKNIGSRLSIDETSLSNGELYTILTNNAAKGKKGVLVAMVKGTKAEDIIEALKIIPLELRRKVKEITLDMAGSMGQIAKRCFPRATRVIDRFHVQKLALDALQEIRIKQMFIMALQVILLLIHLCLLISILPIILMIIQQNLLTLQQIVLIVFRIEKRILWQHHLKS